MSKVIWNTPAPSSGFMRGVQFLMKPQKACSLIFEYEDEDEELKKGELTFTGIAEYKVTFLPALRAEQIQNSYDKLIEVEDSSLLAEVLESCANNKKNTALKHYQICFDDGPCYEVFCESFEWHTS